MPATTITPEAVEKLIAETLPQFGVAPADISPDATFEDLDVDSLDLAELSQIVEDEYGVRLDADDIRSIKTVGEAVDLVVSRAG
jgi:acyl carrier protein